MRRSLYLVIFLLNSFVDTWWFQAMMKDCMVLRNGLNRAYCSVSARLKCQF